TTLHEENIRHLLSPQVRPSSSPIRPNTTPPLLEVLTELTEPATPLLNLRSTPLPCEVSEQFQLDWDAIDHDQLYFPSLQDETLTTMASTLAAWLAHGDDLISSDEDGSSGFDVLDESVEPEPLQPGTARPSQCNNTMPPNPTWFPWPDKQTCILDILRHLPRSLFSDSQLQVILWGLSVLGVDNIPSTRTLKDLDNSLQSQYGIPSVRYQGSLGHVYYVNHLPSIIAQEMANPWIRPHICHYPEDAGGRLEQAWQASRWLHEIDPSIATPMIRKGQQDFYVFELTKLTDGTMVIPERWYTKPSDSQTSFKVEYWALAWRARAVVNGRTSGYIVHAYDTINVPATQLLLSFPHLLQTYEMDHQADPRNIIGLIKTRGHGVLPWTLTDSTIGNRWRAQAQGHRVLNYMMWLYCDDTSGNISKKWNKHNSFLITAAGLPCVMVHKESNIHFLATSNIAPPLEMLDGIVDQLERAQTHGVWAWDVEAREMVLIIPAILAMLGDNPMQSELACHVGLQGKFFCRNCWVKGVDSGPATQALADGTVTNPVDDTHSVETRSHMSESDVSVCEDRLSKGKGRHSETMQDLVDRARQFLGTNAPRTRADTMNRLRSMFHDVASGMSKTRYAKMKAETGIKDTHMDVFVERIVKCVKGIRAGTDKYTEAVDAILQGRPLEEFMSPVWRIKGLDPHQDTPVEILHVILLGFVKYFWRDAISRLNDVQKAELQVRLASFDVSGLGIPRLAGQTLVQYAGSLTGRDFRAISQATPFVLYDLVLCECYEAFLALCSLVPLVWQPRIDNAEEHLVHMQSAIDHFLNCMARWTPRWFNKPKFHIIRHLPDHIQHFGPAILFATEGFESYNAVIRDHSIHSNRQAPSRDIAHGMARCHHVCHFLSGGRFHVRGPITTELPYSNDEHEWLAPGSGVQSLLNIDVPSFRNVIVDFFRLADDTHQIHTPGSCIPDKVRPRPLDKTSTAIRVPHTLRPIKCRLYQTCHSVTASNGDMCHLGDFILSRDPHTTRSSPPIIGRLHEILQICHSSAQRWNQASSLLAKTFYVIGSAGTYHMPRIRPSSWVMLPAKAIICCVNVQHNCAGQGCTGSLAVPIYEEREKTTKTAQRIEHHDPSDLVLNTAQMRDAAHMQKFRIQVQQLERDQAIHTGAVAEINAQKLKTLKTLKAKPTRQSVSSSSTVLPARQPSVIPAHFINVFHRTGKPSCLL
ncbi:hypothetical protein BKA82DRAFT_151609, partial [Pisolithus tinctorius]